MCKRKNHLTPSPSPGGEGDRKQSAFGGKVYYSHRRERLAVKAKKSKMNQGQLIKALISETKETKAASRRFLKAFMKVIMSALKKGDKVVLKDFGTFEVRKRRARMGHNPKTGEAVKIPARRVVWFKVGAELAAKIR